MFSTQPSVWQFGGVGMKEVKSFVRYLFFILMGVASIVSGATDMSVYYEPAIISIEGILEKHTFPGRPNYANIAEGDEPERGVYLRLDAVIKQVMPNPKEIYSWEAENDITVMQLSVDPKQYWSFREGDHVRLTGSLYQGHNGHHHTRVLMSVDKLEVLARAQGQVPSPPEELREGLLE